MKNLKLFYKEEIKSIATDLKFSKPRWKKLQSLRSKGLEESEEYKSVYADLSTNSRFSSSVEARHLYLAYALIRGKDPAKAEKNYPEGHDKRYLERLMKSMEESFQASLIKEEA